MKPARERLLDGAAALIIEARRIDISLSEIAARTGLNAALVKYYFGSKTGMLVALARRDAERALREMDQLLRKPIAAREKMRLHLRGIMEAYARSPYLNRLLHALLRGPDPAAAAELRDHLARPVLECQRRILQEGRRSGEFREVDPAIFYLSATGACDQFMQLDDLLALEGGAAARENFQSRYADFVVNMLLASLAAGEGHGSGGGT